MNPTIYLTSSQITILATTLSVAFVIIVGVLIFVLVRFVYIPNKYKKQIKNLEQKYYYIDGLFKGQDSNYLHRIENISRTNLLYVNQYDEFNSLYKHINDFDDRYAEQMVKKLSALLSNKRYKDLKKAIDDANKSVNIFEESVTDFDKKLQDFIKPEEDSRQKILKLKETYRGIKNIYNGSGNDLELVASSFNTVFDKLDHIFQEYDDHIDSAEYEDANNLYPTIEKVLNSLDDVLKDLPNLCLLIEQIIPDQIHGLTAKYNEIENKEVPIVQIDFKNLSHKWNGELKAIKDKLRNLDTNDVERECTHIQQEIEAVSKSIDEEETDKDLFTSSNEDLYRKVNELDSRFIKAVSLLPDIQQVYSIDEQELQKIEDLRGNINKVAAAKRDLDTTVHSSAPQPYSVLYHKLEQLQSDYDEASNGLDDFTTYLDSLKVTCENAYSLMFDYLYKAKEIEAEIRSLSLDDLFYTYVSNIDKCYDLINELNDILRMVPINVTLVNEKLKELQDLASSTFSEAQDLVHTAKLAESSIVYANRDRNQQNDVHTQLLIIEREFYSGAFALVYSNANKLYQSKHVDETSHGQK
ncbi:MAG: septation ring formation regulator EzrA [Coprobacillus sp.]|nr:septation ring formation regulator EzrA [Coprobacillus sp.]